MGCEGWNRSPDAATATVLTAGEPELEALGERIANGDSAASGVGGALMVQYRRISWWYWLGMALLLAAGLGGWSMGFVLAVILGVVQTVHFLVEDRSVRAFPVQVRLAYLGLLVIGPWVPANGLYWFMFVGTTAMVLFGYCFLARTLTLLPWNRSEPLTIDLLRRTYFAAPVAGNIRQGLPAA